MDRPPIAPACAAPNHLGAEEHFSQAPSAWTRTREVRDVDDLASAQPDWSLEYEQLSLGTFEGRLHLVQLPQVTLVCESASRATRQRGQIGAGHIGFAMCLSPAGSGRFHGRKVDGDTIMIGRGDDLDLTLREDYRLLAIVVSIDLLRALWEQLYGKPWSSWLDHKITVQARAGLADFVRSTHLRALETVMEQAELLSIPQPVTQLRDAVLIEWLESIPAMVDVGDLHNIETRRRIVDRACEVVLGSPDQQMTMLEVCRQVGSSPRRLELCFRDVLGISPHKYLRAVRLCGARRELKRLVGTDARVHDVAARWGFWHTSAFSADYKQQFGESPSLTLRSA